MYGNPRLTCNRVPRRPGRALHTRPHDAYHAGTARSAPTGFPLFMRPFPPGCFALVLLAAVLLLPLLLADVMLTALAKLGLSPVASLLAATGIFLGGIINIPVKRIPREETVVVPAIRLFGIGRLMPHRVKRQTTTVIAINVGGCLVPTGLALYQLTRLAGEGLPLLAAALGAVAINTLVCYWLAEPVPEQGIRMPALVPVLVAVASAYLLAPGMAPPVAFTAGVLGPLLGADLLHLDDIKKIGAGVASIGGAGTFDGIVLSGLAATVLA